MTVHMPQDTVDSEVCVKTPRGHSTVSMDPMDILYLEKTLEQASHS